MNKFRSHNCNELKKKDIGSEVILYGMISNENNENEHSLSVRLTKGTLFSASFVLWHL